MRARPRHRRSVCSRIGRPNASSWQPVVDLRHVSDTQSWTNGRRGLRREEIDFARKLSLDRAPERDAARTDGRRLAAPGAHETDDLKRDDAAARGGQAPRAETKLPQ